MPTYWFHESQECRGLLEARRLTRGEAQAMHAERIAALEREGWKRSDKSIVDIQPYLGREGQEICLLKGGKSRLVRWEEEV